MNLPGPLRLYSNVVCRLLLLEECVPLAAKLIADAAERSTGDVPVRRSLVLVPRLASRAEFMSHRIPAVCTRGLHLRDARDE